MVCHASAVGTTAVDPGYWLFTFRRSKNNFHTGRSFCCFIIKVYKGRFYFLSRFPGWRRLLLLIIQPVERGWVLAKHPPPQAVSRPFPPLPLPVPGSVAVPALDELHLASGQSFALGLVALDTDKLLHVYFQGVTETICPAIGEAQTGINLIGQQDETGLRIVAQETGVAPASHAPG